MAVEVGGQLTMPVSGYDVGYLQAYVNPTLALGSWTETETAFASDCWNTAVAMVDNLIGTTAVVPDAVTVRAYVETGAELWQRRKAPSGITQYLDPNGGSARLARDPLTGALAILGPWLVGIA